MNTEERERINTLIDIALHMAQELQEYVDVAIECSGSNSAELATQELLKDLEAALSKAANDLETCKEYIPRDVYQYSSNKRVHEQVDGFISAAREKL